MDTSDVSTILKPKSIFNPYAKQHRNKTHDLHTAATITKEIDDDNNGTSVQINTGNTDHKTNNIVYDRAPLILTHTNSTNPSEPTSSTAQDITQTTTTPTDSTNQTTVHISNDNLTSTEPRTTSSNDHTEEALNASVEQKYEELTEEEI
jgi:predicted metal-dependent hydrolase